MPNNYDSELAKKLNLKSGSKVRVLGQPADVALSGLALTTSADAEGVIVFVRTLADLAEACGPDVEAARQDRIAWLVYPKARQLGTDLNRDILWQQMLTRGIQPVRQVAVDAVWSALRFRPGQ